MISLVDLIFHRGAVTPQCELPLFRSIRITESSDAHVDKGGQFSYSDFKLNGGKVVEGGFKTVDNRFLFFILFSL
jgi:hypothetical protein